MKIEKDNERGQSLQSQKFELLNTRRNNRDEAGRRKEFMQKKFEILKRKGEIDVSFLLSIHLLIAKSPMRFWNH